MPEWVEFDLKWGLARGGTTLVSKGTVSPNTLRSANPKGTADHGY